jgi:hypothetical protein
MLLHRMTLYAYLTQKLTPAIITAFRCEYNCEGAFFADVLFWIGPARVEGHSESQGAMSVYESGQLFLGG